jgi:DNA-3-methyladenine glycosylase I
MSLREELQHRFSGLGPITSLHFLTDCGLPVLKPDRVVCRVLYRLGLIEDESRIIDAVIAGRRLAEATGEPIRYVDIVLVAYGQVGSEWLGLPQGICLSDKPACHLCGVIESCRWDGRSHSRRQAVS